MKKLKLSLYGFILLSILLAACNTESSTAPDQAPTLQAGKPSSSTPVEESAPLPSVSGIGQTYSVASNGSDTNDGSSASPWETIQHAVDSVAPGDTILIESGTYVGARIEQSGTANNWIKLQAAPGASVLINAPGPNNRHESNLEFETWEGTGHLPFWHAVFHYLDQDQNLQSNLLHL